MTKVTKMGDHQEKASELFSFKRKLNFEDALFNIDIPLTVKTVEDNLQIEPQQETPKEKEIQPEEVKVEI
jgi:hypothetical protein